MVIENTLEQMELFIKNNGIIIKENEQLKKTRLIKAHFKMFTWDPNNMLNN